VIRFGSNIVFLKVSLFDQYFALATGLLSSADAFDFHTQVTSGVEKDGAFGDFPTPP
jgi:hypothetical protein